jgi:CRISPR-associated endonuclease/helicase Cas3
MPESYPEFFRAVTGNDILPYQEQYGANPFSSTLVVVPTGLGKTDTVLLPWLYAVRQADAAVPKRLIVVLPRQNLTSQTAKNARKRLAAANLSCNVTVLELMAGSADNKEKLPPHEHAIIVCTQDLYFSRALNRGFARRPPRWPIDFALYNQDCLIVLDEIQLMDDALATSRQLAAFRREFGTYGSAPCIWMSATVNPDWLRTIDCPDLPPALGLTNEDLIVPIVAKRLQAPKKIQPAPEACKEPEGCAAFALENHIPGTRTLIIANTVARARETYRALLPKYPGAVLLHSRFRPADRQKAADRLEGFSADQIVVATQVLEAGVDITSRSMIADIAPWGSMVQRFGRVNRYGDDADARIWWVDQPAPSSAKQKNPTAPYDPSEISHSRSKLEHLTSAAPADLPPEDGPEPWQHVLRRADLLDLFDTTSDLSGNELDVSRFIRATEEKDAYLAWREWEGDAEPPSSLKELADRELCPVSLGDLREFIAKKHAVYSWNFATEKWVRADKDRLYAGMLLVTRSVEGGYTPSEGWSPESKTRVEPLNPGDEETQGDSGDPDTWVNYRQTLIDHTRRVMEELELLIADQPLSDEHRRSLRNAASKHDWGKAHPVFQETLHRNDPGPELLAKQKNSGRHERRHFRHELASALAMLATGSTDLEAYLVAAHHGKVRMGIRSMPGETEPDRVRIARGLKEGDMLPACQIAPGLHLEEVPLSLAPMEFGASGGSWTDRMIALRDSIGPFRLAYLEALLRAADEKASAEPKFEAASCR